MIELARAQDEEVGDGTSSVIILAGEVLAAVEGFLDRDIHPTVIVSAYFKALDEIVRLTDELGVSNSNIVHKRPNLCIFFLQLEPNQHGKQHRSD